MRYFITSGRLLIEVNPSLVVEFGGTYPSPMEYNRVSECNPKPLFCMPKKVTGCLDIELPLPLSITQVNDIFDFVSLFTPLFFHCNNTVKFSECHNFVSSFIQTGFEHFFSRYNQSLPCYFMAEQVRRLMVNLITGSGYCSAWRRVLSELSYVTVQENDTAETVHKKLESHHSAITNFKRDASCARGKTNQRTKKAVHWIKKMLCERRSAIDNAKVANNFDKASQLKSVHDRLGPLTKSATNTLKPRQVSISAMSRFMPRVKAPLHTTGHRQGFSVSHEPRKLPEVRRSFQQLAFNTAFPGPRPQIIDFRPVAPVFSNASILPIAPFFQNPLLMCNCPLFPIPHMLHIF